MKHLSLLKNLALACCTVATITAVSSCLGPIDPADAAAKLRSGGTVTVYSYDDAAAPQYRDVLPAGPLPARAERALHAWLRESVVKEFSYAYPQYYISIVQPGSSETVWAVCSDGHGNMVGVLIPKNGRAAWDAPFTSEHTMYVCEGPDAKALGDAIMESLADAGYDRFRLDTRRAQGLTQQRYLISKPLTDNQQRRLELIRRAEDQAAAAREAAANAAQEAANNGENAPEIDLLEGTDDDVSGDDELDLEL